MDQQQDERKQKKVVLILVAIFVPLVLLAGFVAYLKVTSVERKAEAPVSQEQFAGEIVVSSQLQTECQKSAEKIAKGSDLDAAFSEYQQHAVNCREIYFVISGNSRFRNEGVYPDLAVDIAVQFFKSDKPKALQVLNFAKGIPDWEFNIGPAVCDSKAVIEAYEESFNLPEEKVCVKISDYRNTLIPELKKLNFTGLTRMIPNDKVVWVGLPESEVGCPQKISSILKLLQKTASLSQSLEENKAESSEASVSFTYRTKSEDKLTLDFLNSNGCLQLRSVLVPGPQANE